MTPAALTALTPPAAGAALAAADMVPGGWVISLVGAIITAGLSGLAGWKIRDRAVETKISGQPISVRRATDFATVTDLKQMTGRVRVVEERIEHLVTALRAEEEARTVRLHDRIDKQDQLLKEILRSLGRLEGGHP